MAPRDRRQPSSPRRISNRLRRLPPRAALTASESPPSVSRSTTSRRRSSARLASGAGRPEARPASSLSTRAWWLTVPAASAGRARRQVPCHAVRPANPALAGRRRIRGRRSAPATPPASTRVSTSPSGAMLLDTEALVSPPMNRAVSAGAWNSRSRTQNSPSTPLAGSANPSSASDTPPARPCTTMERRAKSLIGRYITISPSTGPEPVRRGKIAPRFAATGLERKKSWTAPASPPARPRTTSRDSRQSSIAAMPSRKRRAPTVPRASSSRIEVPVNSARPDTPVSGIQPGA